MSECEQDEGSYIDDLSYEGLKSLITVHVAILRVAQALSPVQVSEDFIKAGEDYKQSVIVKALARFREEGLEVTTLDDSKTLEDYEEMAKEAAKAYLHELIKHGLKIWLVRLTSSDSEEYNG